MIYNDLSLQQTSFNQINTGSSDFCNAYLENGNDYFPKNGWGECYGVCWNCSYGDRVFLKFPGDIPQNCLFHALTLFLINIQASLPKEKAVPIVSYSTDCPNTPNFSMIYYCNMYAQLGCILVLGGTTESCIIFPRYTTPFYSDSRTFVISGYKKL